MVAQSSIEAEYKSLANAATESSWLMSLSSEIGIHMSHPLVLWHDNINATYLSTNSVFRARTKHVDIDFHFVCDMVAKKLLSIKFISNKDQLADIFTKPLFSSRFGILLSKLNVLPIPLRLKRRIRELVKPTNKMVKLSSSTTTKGNKDQARTNLSVS